MQKQTQQRIRINHFIRVPQVRVLDAEGTLLGVLQTHEALSLAKEKGLDLVEISPKAMPPVCKIIDFGKYKFEAKKQEAAAKKNQKNVEVKEIVMKPGTDEGDLLHKLKAAKGFLEEGNRVKLTVRFRGREITHTQIGADKLSWFVNELGSLVGHATSVALSGKILSTLLTPKSMN